MTVLNGVAQDTNSFRLTQNAKGVFIIEKIELSVPGQDLNKTIDEVIKATQYAVEYIKILNGTGEKADATKINN